MVNKTEKQIATFNASLERLKNKEGGTGHEALDKVGDKVLNGIFYGEVKFKETEEGFVGKLGKAKIKVAKYQNGKSNKTELDVQGVKITGPYSARAYKMAFASLNNKGRKSIEVDEAKVEDVMSLLD